MRSFVELRGFESELKSRKGKRYICATAKLRETRVNCCASLIEANMFCENETLQKKNIAEEQRVC